MIKKWIAVLTLVASGSTSAAEPQKPWFRQVPGEPSVTVQYAKLIGHEADPAKNVAELRSLYNNCATAFRAVGHHVASLPSEGFPHYQHSFEDEVYYANGRTALYSRHTITVVNYAADCALSTDTAYSLSIFDAGGRCQIDLSKQTGSGACFAGKNAKQRATGMRVATPRPPIDWDHIPEPQRSLLKRQFAKLGSNPQSLGEPVPTGVRKRIAGVDCAVSQLQLGPQTFWFCATDAHSVPPPIHGLVPSDLARGLQGIVLEAQNPMMHLQATQFIGNLPVPESVFAIPQGTTYHSR